MLSVRFTLNAIKKDSTRSSRMFIKAISSAKLREGGTFAWHVEEKN